MSNLIVRPLSVVASLCLLALSGCGGSSSDPAPPADIAGNWLGSFDSRLAGGQFGSFDLTYQQTGSKLAGTLRVSNVSGVFTGSVDGTYNNGAVDFDSTLDDPQQTELHFQGTAHGGSISGSYSAGVELGHVTANRYVGNVVLPINLAGTWSGDATLTGKVDDDDNPNTPPVTMTADGTVTVVLESRPTSSSPERTKPAFQPRPSRMVGR